MTFLSSEPNVTVTPEPIGSPVTTGPTAARRLAEERRREAEAIVRAGDDCDRIASLVDAAAQATRRADAASQRAAKAAGEARGWRNAAGEAREALLLAIRTHLEEGLPAKLAAEVLGVEQKVVDAAVRAERGTGE